MPFRLRVTRYGGHFVGTEYERAPPIVSRQDVGRNDTAIGLKPSRISETNHREGVKGEIWESREERRREGEESEGKKILEEEKERLKELHE